MRQGDWLVFKNRNKILITLSLALSFVGPFLVFIGGYPYSGTRLEENAAALADVAKTKTNGKYLCSLTVGANSDSGSLPDPSTEFHNLYGVFKQSRITYSSIINPDKSEHKLTLTTEDQSLVVADDLSVMWGGGDDSQKYNYGKKRYKMSTYPIELLLPNIEIKGSTGGDYFLSISQSQANKIIDQDITKKSQKDEDGNYPFEIYENLVGNKLLLSIDGNIPKKKDGSNQFVYIQNVYFESNYYYDGLKETIGDFVVSKYYLPGFLEKEKKNTYFPNEYSYQNKYFLKYINTVYSSKKYDVRLNNYNLTQNVDTDYLLSFYYSTSTAQHDWAAVLSYTIGILCIVGSIFITYLLNKDSKAGFLYFLAIFASLLLPFFISKILYSITGSIFLLSEMSSRINSICLIAYFFSVLVFKLINTRGKTKNTLRLMEFYEVSI